MKKILVFGMTDNPGGVESVIMNYYNYIDKKSIQFDFLCNYEKIAYENKIKELGGRVFFITPRRVSVYKFRKELDLFMRENAHKYDAIWVNLCSLVNIDYLIFSKKHGIKRRIIHCHNADNDAGILKGIIHKYNRNRLYKYATDFWTCSNEASPWFFNRNIMDSDRYRIIPNAIDMKNYLANKKTRDEVRNLLQLKNKKVVGHVGRFHFQKNHKFLIDIFENLLLINSEYHLLLVGQGEMEEEIRTLVNQKGLKNYVTFCGVRNDVEKLYQAMDFFVLPSVSEGLGIVALEAQACGLPCLLSDAVPKDVKINDNVRFLSLVKGAKEWANTIDELISIPSTNDTVCKNIKTSKYNIELQVKKFEEYLFEL